VQVIYNGAKMVLQECMKQDRFNLCHGTSKPSPNFFTKKITNLPNAKDALIMVMKGYTIETLKHGNTKEN